MGNQVPTKPTSEASSPRTGTYYVNLGDLLVGSMIMNEHAYFGKKSRLTAEEEKEWDELYQEINRGDKAALLKYLGSPHIRINWVPEDGAETAGKVTASDIRAGL